MPRCIAFLLLGPVFLLLRTLPAVAGSDYCHTNQAGDYVCIQSVFGPRNNRGMVWTLNGYVRTSRFNCYNYDYEQTSIIAIACWVYER